MNTLLKSTFRPVIMIAMLMTAGAGVAQETAQDDLMPAVDTSAIEPGVELNAEQSRNAAAPPAPGDATRRAADISRSTVGNRVMDSIELGRTEITGNQELPKVMYIVPWKKSDPGDLMGKPVNSLLDEVLAPIDREEFVRRVEYYGEIYGEREQD